MSIIPKAIYSVNANPIKLPMVFFTKLKQIISQFVWKYRKTSNSQSNLEKEEWNWRNQPASLQALLQSHSHQDTMALAQRQTYRSMEQNRKPRGKSMHLQRYLIFDKVKSEVAQSCPTLCNPVDCSPPGSSIHGILQARILEWVAISFSRGSNPGLPHCRQML